MDTLVTAAKAGGGSGGRGGSESRRATVAGTALGDLRDAGEQERAEEDERWTGAITAVDSQEQDDVRAFTREYTVECRAAPGGRIPGVPYDALRLAAPVYAASGDAAERAAAVAGVTVKTVGALIIACTGMEEKGEEVERQGRVVGVAKGFMGGGTCTILFSDGCERPVAPGKLQLMPADARPAAFIAGDVVCVAAYARPAEKGGKPRRIPTARPPMPGGAT